MMARLGSARRPLAGWQTSNASARRCVRTRGRGPALRGLRRLDPTRDATSARARRARGAPDADPQFLDRRTVALAGPTPSRATRCGSSHRHDRDPRRRRVAHGRCRPAGGARRRAHRSPSSLVYRLRAVTATRAVSVGAIAATHGRPTLVRRAVRADPRAGLSGTVSSASSCSMAAIPTTWMTSAREGVSVAPLRHDPQRADTGAGRAHATPGPRSTSGSCIALLRRRRCVGARRSSHATGRRCGAPMPRVSVTRHRLSRTTVGSTERLPPGVLTRDLLLHGRAAEVHPSTVVVDAEAFSAEIGRSTRRSRAATARTTSGCCERPRTSGSVGGARARSSRCTGAARCSPIAGRRSPRRSGT